MRQILRHTILPGHFIVKSYLKGLSPKRNNYNITYFEPVKALTNATLLGTDQHKWRSTLEYVKKAPNISYGSLKKQLYFTSLFLENEPEFAFDWQALYSNNVLYQIDLDRINDYHKMNKFRTRDSKTVVEKIMILQNILHNRSVNR